MKYELFIGLRYLRSKRRQAFISIIGLISILGVFIGVMALNVVLGVMRGFEEELRDKILGVNSHLVVLSYDGPMEDYERIRKEVSAFPDVSGASPFIYGQGMLVSETNVAGAVIRGIDPQTAGMVTNIEAAVGRGMVGREGKGREGELSGIGKEIITRLDKDTKSGKPPLIIGRELAATLGVSIGDTVSLVSPFGKVGPFGPQAKIKRFEIIGVSDYGMVEYDSSIAYVSLRDAMDFFEMDGKVTGVEVKLKDIYRARDVGERITSALGFPFYTRNWEEVNRSLFRALRLERMAIAIFLACIVLVAALDIVSTLTMVVMEKGKDIAILRAMGATRRGIMTIFITDGMIIGFIGTFLGTVAGLGICYLVKTSDTVKRLIPFDTQVYPVSEFPVKIEPLYFLAVAFFSLLICFLATLYPSYQASQKDPVEALRYE
ncbi:MAG TPA: lipoprotein-releasing ABC transporter permease subunit [Thermodesulfobacteriota bacterium]|jgi:lipoprotein-releasing system permease protein|nr:lipoprotein-releasing ABC transporter permease subunit [Thermodesulfobacteriota bacterium]